MRHCAAAMIAGGLGLVLGPLTCSSRGADGAPAFSSVVPEGEPSSPPSEQTPAQAGASAATGLFSDGALEGEAPPTAMGCSKVDLLFVVDNSLSMLEEQRSLIASFPGFMQVVEDNLGSSDFHVMVIDTDAENVLDLLVSVFMASREACAATLGAGRRRDFRGEDCGLSGSRRYMDRSEQDLSAAFSCAAEVGTLGNPSETPVSAMLAAIDPAQNASGGCNEGFLRDDAILVVTFIGDEDDNTSRAGPAEWHDAVVQAKGDNAESIVMLALIGGDAAVEPELTGCGSESAEPAPRLRALVESFPFGSTGNVCAPDYAPFFERAVEAIDLACVTFAPIIR